MAISAKFAGTCARTGKGYGVGAQIEKMSNGKWALVAGAASSNANTIRVQFINRMIRDVEVMADGRIKTPGKMGRAFFGVAASDLPDFNKDAATGAKSLEHLPHAQLRLDGSRVVCPLTGEVKGTVEGSTTQFEDVILPKLHFHANGELSAKVGPEMWAKIKNFFSYESYADKADWLDQCDYFEEAAQYEGRRGGEWTIKTEADMAKVEDILGILPENRRAEVAKREAEEAERAEKEREAARIERIEKERLDAIEREEKGRVYAAWKEANLIGLVRTYTRIRGEYSALISFDKETPGTWYTTGDDYSEASVDSERVLRCSYGNATCYYATQPAIDAALRAAHQEQVEARGAASAAAHLLASWESYGEGVMGGSDTKRLIELLGLETLQGLAAQPFFNYYPSKALKAAAPNLRELTITDKKDADVAALEAMAKGRVEMRTSPYVRREVATGALIVEVSRQLLTNWNRSEFFTTAEFEALPVVHEWRENTPEGFGASYDFAKVVNLLSGERDIASFDLLRFPDGRLVARYNSTNSRPAFDFDLTPFSIAQLEAARDLVAARKERDKEEKKIAYGRKLLKKSGIEGADLLEKIEDGLSLDSAKKGGTGSGTCTELDKVTLRFKGGEARPAFRVHHEWWHLGEDGDADDDTILFENEAEARASFAEFAAC